MFLYSLSSAHRLDCRRIKPLGKSFLDSMTGIFSGFLLLFSSRLVCEVFEFLCSILTTWGGICDIDNGCQTHLHKLKDRWRT